MGKQKNRPIEPVHSTINKIAGDRFSVVNEFTGKVQTGLGKSEAQALKRKWDNDLDLPREITLRTSSKPQRVDEDGNPMPTKTEIIIDCLMQGMSYKETAIQARCRYQMAHNIGTKYFKQHPQKLNEREKVVEFVKESQQLTNEEAAVEPRSEKVEPA